MRILIIGFLITATVLAGLPGHAQEDPYQRGQSALREQRWAQAVEDFRAAVETGTRPDAALYWQAFALYRSGRAPEARRALRRLENNHPESDWLDDARALKLEMDGGNADDYQDQNLRLYALQQLMHRDPDRALPQVLELVRTARSDETRRQALFILAISNDERGADAIAQIARDSANPELQIQAIHLLATGGSDRALELLAELYRPDADPGVRRAIIDAHLIAGESAPLAAILRAERDPELKRQAIFAIGAMDDTEALRGLYPGIKDPGLRAHVLQAFAIAGAVEELRQIIASERDPGLRADAIRALGLVDDARAAEVLAEVRGKAAGPDDLRAILETLVILDEGADLAREIALASSNPAIQRQAIQTLTILDADDELRGLYREIEDPEARRMLLQQLAVAEDEEALIEVLRTETAPELRMEAIRGVVVADANEAAPVLVSIYPDATPDEKRAIVDALMILEEEEHLGSLLAAEQDPVFKRRILEALMAVGSDLAEDYMFDWIEE